MSTLKEKIASIRKQTEIILDATTDQQLNSAKLEIAKILSTILLKEMDHAIISENLKSFNEDMENYIKAHQMNSDKEHYKRAFLESLGGLNLSITLLGIQD